MNFRNALTYGVYSIHDILEYIWNLEIFQRYSTLYKEKLPSRLSWVTPALLRRLCAEIVVISMLVYWVQSTMAIGRFPGGDGPHIIGTAGRLAQQLADGDWYWFVLCFSSLLGPHPPFAYLPFTISALFFPDVQANYLIGSALVLWLGWDALYRCNAGIVGFLWLICLAPVWLQAENAGIDLIAGVVAIQATSHLIASKQLESRWHSVAWGLWMGVGFMTKYTAPMFLWGPCIMAGYWIIRHKRWKHLGFAVLGFAIIALPWWSTHWQQVQGYVLASSNAGSGLLTNKTMIENPWSAENAMWYPSVVADAMGWVGCSIALIAVLLPNKQKSNYIYLLAILGGWIFVNSQKQRQDRYIIPAYPLLAAGIASAPAVVSIASLPIMWKLLTATREIYTTQSNPPSERSYTHDTSNSGATYPIPHEAYWPISHNPTSWQVDRALQTLRRYVDSDEGTVGFLLDEQGGAPGYGMILSRTVQLGYRWHIATVMIARPQGNIQEKNRPLASIFVGPFLFGEWPPREFSVMLSMVDNKDPQREKWLQSTGMTVVEEWALPQNRTAKIWVKP